MQKNAVMHVGSIFMGKHYGTKLNLTDGMRRPVSRRDAVRSQVIDVLEAQINKETGNEKG